jgi:hypothetical protein
VDEPDFAKVNSLAAPGQEQKVIEPLEEHSGRLVNSAENLETVSWDEMGEDDIQLGRAS